MGVRFTEKQQEVIDARGCNLLVSAAAGSGKTAVLVERIITMLTKDTPSVSVDELLIVTFTEAAAAEMKERIREAMEKALEQDPDNEHLKRQISLIQQAQITTIHSFCMSVIRENFHVIDLDPGFRVGDEGELKLLKHDVLEELLEAYYQEGKAEFVDFVECYASGRDDKKIEELILQIYDFSQSYPDAESWLNECRARYALTGNEMLQQADYIRYLTAYVRQSLVDIGEKMEALLMICRDAHGPYMYQERILEDCDRIRKICKADTYPQLYEELQKLGWDSLPRCTDKDVDEDLATQVKQGRNQAKKIIKSLTDQFFYQAPTAMADTMCQAENNMNMLAELTVKFSEAYAEKKRSRNLIDFNDMEHLALRILIESKDGEAVPSAVARMYQERYREILIDEYQDSNLVQETLLTSVSKVSRGICNIFMVGDVKQSIYRFRLSRPELFMEKYDSYQEGSTDKRKIDLHKNFRSRREVLDSTNFIFRQIMTKGFDGIEYDENASLYVGADYPACEDCETELLLLDKQAFADDVHECEALAVAQRIRELVGHQLVRDSHTGEMRPATYGDIVILMRSLAGWSDVYARVLNDEGIPTYTGSGAGYFETVEIRMVLDYLRILDNPRQDIPLTAVLLHPLTGFTEDDLAMIRIGCRTGCFYDCVTAYVQDGEDLNLREKLRQFLDAFAALRQKTVYLSIYELLCLLTEETGYGDYIAAMPGGRQRKANLQMLKEMAQNFEKTSYKGLFHFVRYVGQLQKYEVDYGEASLSDESASVVRMMSIHKSKGLEFPIVIVAGMGKQFNRQDTVRSILLHSDLGIGLDAIDYERRTIVPTLLKNVLKLRLVQDMASEELRILYVAMTRAKEKLIMIGSQDHMANRLKDFTELRFREKTSLPYTRIAEAKSYLDWVLPALYRNQSMGDYLNSYDMEVPFANPLYRQESYIRVRRVDPEILMCKAAVHLTKDCDREREIQDIDPDRIYDSKFYEHLKEQLLYVYPSREAGRLYQTLSVSELKKQAYEEEQQEQMFPEEEVYPLLPGFLKEKEALGAADRGTAYHRVMELLDYTATENADDLIRQKDRWVEKGLIKREMAEVTEDRDVLRFLGNDLGRRMVRAAKAEKLYCEQPFVIGMKSEEIRTDYPAGEMILVEGIIDVWFEEDDGLVILDYKTDRVRSANELIKRYEAQMKYYARALAQLTGRPVCEMWIYSFHLGEEIRIL